MKRTPFRVLALLLCACVLVSVSGAIFIARAAFVEGKPYDEYTYQEYMALTSQEKTQFFYGFPTLSAFNQWYNAAKRAADNEKVVIGNNSIDLGDLLKVVATIGDVKYSKLNDALEAAVSGNTIVLAADAEGATVVVPQGVTLDLNGFKLTVDEFGFVPNAMGKIIDSSENSTGLLCVGAENAVFLSQDVFAENTLPVYDAAQGGYRFFSYTTGQSVAQTDTQVAGAAKFWYQLHFELADVYELLYAGESGLKMGVNIDYTGAQKTIGCVFVKDGTTDAWCKSYAEFVLGYDDGTVAQNPWLWVRVQGADSVTGLTVTPYVTVGGADIYLTPITYGAQ